MGAILGGFLKVAVTSKTALGAHAALTTSTPMWGDLVPKAWSGDGAAP